MQTFLQSAFLQALGYAIANSLWQVALLWLIVVLINNFGKLSSSKKYFTGIVAEFTGFVWFLCTLEFYYSKCKQALEVSGAASINNNHAYILEPSINNFSSAILYFSVKGEQLLPYLSIAYLCMLFFLVIRLSRAFYSTQQIRKKGLQKADIDLRLFVKRTAAYLGIKKEIKIYLSALIKSPLTIGFLKPLILIPVASINHLTTDQLEALLLHELAHIKRADYLINILQSVIEIVLFFNPFVQLLGKLIKEERENSCDDWVLQFQYNPAMYAEALLRIASIPAKQSFTMNATGSKNDLLSRVKRMLNKQEKSHCYRNQVFALMLITIMLSCAAWFNPDVKYNSTITSQTSSETRKVVVEPLSASVDNPFFNPIYFLSKPIQQELNNAIDIANDKIEETAPVVEKTTSQVLARIAPIALEKLQNLNDVKTEMATAFMQAANANKVAEQLKIKNTPSLTIDTTGIITAIKDAFLNTKEWKEVETEIQKAQKEILALNKDKNWTLTSRQISDVLKNTADQLEGLSENNFTVFTNSLQNVTETAKQKIEESSKKLFREQQKKEKQKVRECEQKSEKAKTLNTYSDIEDENALADKDEYNNLVKNYNQSLNNTPVYTPAQFSENNYIYNITDSILNSAIIIVKHNPANDSSHTKHITVEITGDNGMHKTYEFTVEVYQ